MIAHALPVAVRLVIFDLDNTLYRNDSYVAMQLDSLVVRLAAELNRDVDEMRETVNSYRDDEQRRTGKRPSMAASFATLGVPIERSAEWRAQLFHPEAYLERDERLAGVLASLAPARLAVVSNNPVPIVERTLHVLGVRSFFSPVFGLDTCMVPKPDPCAYHLVYRETEIHPEKSVAVGDRFAVDIAPVLALGGGGVELEPADTVHPVGALLKDRINGA